MTRRSPFVIELSSRDRAVLKQRARAYTAPHHQVVRAKIVLLAADGLENTVIAERLDVGVQLVSKWRKRFFEQGVAGLKDRPRTGRPRAFPPVTVVQVKALACELPAETEVPLSRWSAPELAVEAVDRGMVETISASTVRRWLAADALKPWQQLCLVVCVGSTWSLGHAAVARGVVADSWAIPVGVAGRDCAREIVDDARAVRIVDDAAATACARLADADQQSGALLPRGRAPGRPDAARGRGGAQRARAPARRGREGAASSASALAAGSASVVTVVQAASRTTRGGTPRRSWWATRAGVCPTGAAGARLRRGAGAGAGRDRVTTA